MKIQELELSKLPKDAFKEIQKILLIDFLEDLLEGFPKKLLMKFFIELLKKFLETKKILEKLPDEFSKKKKYEHTFKENLVLEKFKKKLLMRFFKELLEELLRNLQEKMLATY